MATVAEQRLKAPFETEAAISDLPRYDGRDKKEMCRKKVSYYLHSRNHEMKNVLRLAELDREVIRPESLDAAKYQNPSWSRFSR